MKYLTQDIEELKEEYYREKYETGLYLSAGMVIAIAAIVLSCITSFIDAIPLYIASTLLFIISYKSWCYHNLLETTIDLMETANKFFDKDPLPKEDKND